MRSWSPEAIEAIVSGVSTTLRRAGFHREGDLYQRRRGQLTDFVWFEAIKYDPDSDFASFDVRFGIHIGGIEGIEFGIASWDPLAPPCHITRQSEPLFWDREIWWDPHDPSSTAIPRVAATIRDSALPFFDDRFRTLDTLLDEFERDYLEGRPPEERLRVLTAREKIMAMRIRLSRGERQRAEEVFRRLCLDRAEAEAIGIPQQDPLVGALLLSVAQDADFLMH
jgi:hypothetical protein